MGIDQFSMARLFDPDDPQAVAVFCLMAANNDLRIASRIIVRALADHGDGTLDARTTAGTLQYCSQMALMHLHEVREILDSAAIRQLLPKLDPDLQKQNDDRRKYWNRNLRQRFANLRNSLAGHYLPERYEAGLRLLLTRGDVALEVNAAPESLDDVLYDGPHQVRYAMLRKEYEKVCSEGDDRKILGALLDDLNRATQQVSLIAHETVRLWTQMRLQAKSA